MERGHNGGFNAHRDSHGRYAPAASATRTPHPRATVAHQEGNVRILQQPIAEQGDEITLTPEDEAILDLIWDQIAAESNPNTVMKRQFDLAPGVCRQRPLPRRLLMARRPLQTDRHVQRLRIAIYVRVSTDDQADNGYGIEVQLQQCKAMAMVKNGDVVGIYDDAGISGTKGESKRPELARLMRDIRSGKLDMVIIAALDRLGRNTRIILDLIERMTDEGVEIVSCKESLDTSTPTGKFVLTMFAALAQLDRDNIVKRTTDGRDARGRKDGEKGGNVPLGFTRNDEGIVVDPPAAALVRRIFLLRGAPSSLGDIAAVLNMEGVPTPRSGRSWYPSTVREVLTHETAYRGGKRGVSEARWPIILDSAVPRLPADKRKRRGASKARQSI